MTILKRVLFFAKIVNDEVVEAGVALPDYIGLSDPGVVILETRFDPNTQYALNGAIHTYTVAELAAKTAPHSYYDVWSNVTMSYSDPRSLEERKKYQILVLRGAMENKMLGGFNSGGNKFSSETEDQFAIQVLVLQATMAKIDGAAFTIVIDDINDNPVSLNRGGVLQLGTDLQQMLSNARDKFRTLKATVKAATTIEQVVAVVW